MRCARNESERAWADAWKHVRLSRGEVSAYSGTLLKRAMLLYWERFMVDERQCPSNFPWTMKAAAEAAWQSHDAGYGPDFPFDVVRKLHGPRRQLP